MDTNNAKAIELWNNTWTPETHTTEYATKRIKSAQSAKLTPIKIDTNDMYGYFQGNSGRYETFLDYCPCGDFIRSKLPCKHIYRLAIELGVLNYEVKSNSNAILTPENERISLSKTIDIVESLSENAQRTLLQISSGMNSAFPTCLFNFNDYITELLISGIITDAEPENHQILFGKKAELIDFLNNENISFNPKAKKSILENICKEFALEKAEKVFGYTICIAIPTKFSAQNIHNYLHRKYDTDIYYDINGACLIPLLNTNLPNDNITIELIKRGYYTR